jgi:hypothetical protein
MTGRRHRPILRTCLALAVVGVSGACADDGEPSATNPPRTFEVQLADARPEACIHVDATHDAAVVEFHVTVMANPGGQGLEIDVRDASGETVTVLGMYPPDAPQTFTVRLASGDYTIDMSTNPNREFEGQRIDVSVDGASPC